MTRKIRQAAMVIECLDGQIKFMNELSPRFLKIFFEVYENLPRQGPGNRTCAAKAIDLCSELPESPVILDLGCGVGAQTFYLTELTAGSIEAVDKHAPFVELLQAAALRRKLSHRILARVGDMANLEYRPRSLDLIWSEGALYSIGLRNALHVCHGLLRPGGYLSFTDAIWRKDNPPPAVRAGFDFDYPAMGSLGDDLAAIQDCGFELIGHFTLPDEAWGRIFIRPWSIASKSCETNMRTMQKPRPYSINLQRSLICTVTIQISMPMSFLLHVLFELTVISDILALEASKQYVCPHSSLDG